MAFDGREKATLKKGKKQTYPREKSRLRGTTITITGHMENLNKSFGEEDHLKCHSPSTTIVLRAVSPPLPLTPPPPFILYKRGGGGGRGMVVGVGGLRRTLL